MGGPQDRAARASSTHRARGLPAHEDGHHWATLSGTPNLTLGSALRTVSRSFQDGPAPRQLLSAASIQRSPPGSAGGGFQPTSLLPPCAPPLLSVALDDLKVNHGHSPEAEEAAQEQALLHLWV